ncbi:MAG: DUF4153 domain-containing protein [Helicobacteraceae bacterium]|nr:DUF4153 domain-containing protein [Helicobacteraceae bacterium]
MSLKERISKYFGNISIYFKSAFIAYKISVVIALTFGIILTLCIFDIATYRDFEKYFFLLFISFLFALFLESLNLSFFQNRLKDIFIEIAKIALVGVVAYIIYINIITPLVDNEEKLYFFKEIYYFTKYISLSLIFLCLFAVFNLKYNFKSLLDSISFVFLVGIFVVITLILFGIFLLTLDFLFRVDEIFLLKQFCAYLVWILVISSIIFIGREAMLNHYKIKNYIVLDFTFSKNIKFILIILNVFCYVYAFLLLLYFILLYFGVTYSISDSVVHLIIWFSFFSIFLTWLNNGFSETFNKKIFFVLLFILNVIATNSIIIRINQYGITPNRYFIALFCVFIYICIALNFFKKDLKILLIILIICVFCGIFSPFNAVSVSINSQLKALQVALDSNDNERVYSILHFLDKYNVKYDEKYKTYLKESHKKSVSYSHKTYHNDRKIIDISKFNNLIYMDNSDSSNIKYNLKHKYDRKSDIFRIFSDENVFLEINDFSKIVYKFIQNNDKNKDDFIELDFKGKKFKMIFIYLYVSYAYYDAESSDIEFSKNFKQDSSKLESSSKKDSEIESLYYQFYLLF